MSANPKTAILVYENNDQLTYPPGHPFRPERAGMFMDILNREGLLREPWLQQVSPVKATMDQLTDFHRRDYLKMLQSCSQGEMLSDMFDYGLGTDDCPLFSSMFDLAALSAGASLLGAQMLLSNDATIVFNPVGGYHHAGAANAEGFCYVNDVVLACKHLAGVDKKVACVDLDVHHGNGTETAFLDNNRVLTISVHESGKLLYPWSGFEDKLGENDGKGFNINIPMLEQADDDAFSQVLEGIILPALERFQPDFIVAEIGMDALAGDPLAHLNMTNNAIADAMIEIAKLKKPILALGGGGYHPQNAARGWALALMAMCSAEPNNDHLTMMGGVFLGGGNHSGSLRDMRVYTSGEQRTRLDEEVARLIEFHKKNTLPLL